MHNIHTVGGRRLSGEVRLSGSKNATLAILAATPACRAGSHDPVQYPAHQ